MFEKMKGYLVDNQDMLKKAAIITAAGIVGILVANAVLTAVTSNFEIMNGEQYAIADAEEAKVYADMAMVQ